ncbi:PREDICTED: uncharacterized protein LOC107164362 [Diuraphis noxia]|uniref:uncharacterized protein LOC107164362 n=1 Tax=Diuraphis noxia TaxID=143948 RepID=UPI0007637235|nr:PREDICTED: uncharacterized protein LOC107164362 [Diuraphis noxia]
MSKVCVLCLKPVLKYSIPKMSLHVFPSCPKKRQIWLNQCRLSHKDILPNRKICSLHFKPTCFKSGLKRRVLYPDAIPTIFGNGIVKTTKLPLKNVKGRSKNCTKKGIVVQNRKSRDISSVKAANTVVNGQNRQSCAVTPRVVTHADFDRINSILENQIAELNGLEGVLTELNKEKLSLGKLLELLVRNQISLGN